MHTGSDILDIEVFLPLKFYLMQRKNFKDLEF
jgi:hypothetical protein